MKGTRKSTKTTAKKTFAPKRYYAGLSTRKKIQRKREIAKFGALSWKNPAAYVGFQTDKGIRTKPSGYTKRWKRMFPDARSLEEKADATGVPVSYLRKVYNRGLAAWRTGHRPGATEQQWGYARVHSFLLCGKTYHSTDSDLVRKAVEESKTARSWWAKVCNSP